MKLLLVSDATNVHTKRWASALSARGLKVFLLTMFPYTEDDFYLENGVELFNFDLFYYKSSKSSIIEPLKAHIKALVYLRSLIKRLNPDILHAHYLTSNTYLAALSGFKPLVLSAWGTDVYEFPKESWFKSMALRLLLKRANMLLSTSNCMAKELSKYTNKYIEILPFGIDTERFRKLNKERDLSTCVIGNVKTLAPRYGVDVLIKAFKILCDRNETKKLYLEILGRGPQREELEQLVRELELEDRVTFVGFIPNHELPKYYDRFSVAVFLSNAESFGVSAIEAMSCECPIVVSDAEGFCEIVDDGINGCIVSRQNPDDTASAIEYLLKNYELAQKYARAGREKVKFLYQWEKCVDKMLELYTNLIKQ